jgi:hypothetical protein
MNMEEILSRFNKLIGLDRYKKRDFQFRIEKFGTDFYVRINGIGLLATIYVERHPYCTLYDRITIEMNRDLFSRYFYGDMGDFYYHWLTELCQCISYKDTLYYGIYYGYPLY